MATLIAMVLKPRNSLSARLRPALAILALSVGGVALGAGAPVQGSAQPPSAGKPGGAPWTFDFTPKELRLFVDQASGTSYWCMTYTVTNLTGADRQWMPKVEMLDDRGRIHAAGRSVPPSVTKSVKDLLGDPLLEDQFQIIGVLRQGRENAKDGLLIWSAEPCDATEITVFVRGLSGETEVVEDPVTKAPVTLYRTARLEYVVPGDVKARGMKPVPLDSRDWIFR